MDETSLMDRPVAWEIRLLFLLFLALLLSVDYFTSLSFAYFFCPVSLECKHLG